MNGKTHILFAEAAFVAAALITTDSMQFMGTTVSPGLSAIPGFVAAVLPDVDMKQSTLGQKFPLVSKLFTHRGFTHTAIANAGLLFLFLGTRGKGDSWQIVGAQSLMFGVVFAYASHLVADSLNYRGIPLFWPLSSKHIYIMKITTGGKSEKIFIAVYIALILLHLATFGL